MRLEKAGAQPAGHCGRRFYDAFGAALAPALKEAGPRAQLGEEGAPSAIGARPAPPAAGPRRATAS
eukprot:4000548-Pyramimonas_sp.AAC.1